MKRISAVMLSMLLLLSLISFPNATFAQKPAVDKEITLDDINLEAGKVDIEKLPKELKKKVKDRIKEVNTYFEDLSKAKVAYQIQQKKGKINGIENSELTDAENQYEYLYNNSDSIAGLVLAPSPAVEEGFITPYATVADVAVPKPNLYWDKFIGMYVMNGSWDWYYNPDLDPGGADGFGLKAVQRKVSVLDASIATYNSSGTATSHSYSEDAGNYGIGFRFQDRSMGASYSGHAGSAWMYFKWYSGTPIGYAINYRSVYAHSWKTTSLNSFSIGADSFGLGWSSENYKFPKENWNVVQY